MTLAEQLIDQLVEEKKLKVGDKVMVDTGSKMVPGTITDMGGSKQDTKKPHYDKVKGYLVDFGKTSQYIDSKKIKAD